MSYDQVEQALASQISQIPGFSTAVAGNVTRGDYRVISRGVSTAILLEYAGFNERIVEFRGEHETDWRINIDLFTRWENEDVAYGLAGSMRQSVIERIRQYPKLGTDIIFQARIESGDPAPEDIQMGGVRYAVEILRLIATENISVSYAE
jgi:hypothetical protein